MTHMMKNFSPSIVVNHDIKENFLIPSLKLNMGIFKPGGFSPYVDNNLTSVMGISNQKFNKRNILYEN